MLVKRHGTSLLARSLDWVSRCVESSHPLKCLCVHSIASWTTYQKGIGLILPNQNWDTTTCGTSGNATELGDVGRSPWKSSLFFLTGKVTLNGQLYENFTKTIWDNFLWQLVDQPTKKDHILDLVLTNIPHKISNLEIFDDIICTDHKLIQFYLDLNIPKLNKVSESVFNFKKAQWNELRIALTSAPWDQVFVYDCINTTLSNWTNMFMEIVENYVPKLEIKNSNSTPWIDQDVIRLLRKKDKQRFIANKSLNNEDLKKYKQLSKQAKQLIDAKYAEYLNNMRMSVKENLKRFWTFVRAKSAKPGIPKFINFHNAFASNPVDKANLFNDYFQSVFLATDNVHSVKLDA